MPDTKKTMGKGMAGQQHVYCFQQGSRDCYKIGKSKEPEKRRRKLQTGSAEGLRPCRCIPTPDATALEKYIHHLLDGRRTGEQEFFWVTEQELDQAIAEAVKFVEATSDLFSEAKELAKHKPDTEMRDPSDEMLGVYKELREAEHRFFKLGKQIEILESRMKVFIGRHSGIKGLATWRWKPNRGMNIPKFQKEQRDLYERYLVDRSRREFKALKADLTELSP
jgi:hypothetical protein